jgi:hypothetical protein
MNESIFSLMVELLKEAHDQGQAQTRGAVLFHNRGAAYDSGPRDGSLYDLTTRGLVASVMGRVHGITESGEEALALVRAIESKGAGEPARELFDILWS